MSWPKNLKEDLKGKIITTPAHVIDIMPTCLDIADGKYPTRYNGNVITPNVGMSLLPLALGDHIKRAAPIFWEHEGNRAMRDGKWKIVSNLTEPWKLYNLNTDRTETRNVVKQNPEILKAMLKTYDTWYKRVGAKPYFTEPKEWQIMQGEKPTVKTTKKE